MTNVIDQITADQRRDDIPAFRAGDTLKVHVNIVEGNRSRVQVFQGVCIRIHGSGIGRTFTVRKVSFGVGVERTFPLHSPSRQALLPAQLARQGSQDQGKARPLIMNSYEPHF